MKGKCRVGIQTGEDCCGVLLSRCPCYRTCFSPCFSPCFSSCFSPCPRLTQPRTHQPTSPSSLDLHRIFSWKLSPASCHQLIRRGQEVGSILRGRGRHQIRHCTGDILLTYCRRLLLRTCIENICRRPWFGATSYYGCATGLDQLLSVLFNGRLPSGLQREGCGSLSRTDSENTGMDREYGQGEGAE